MKRRVRKLAIIATNNRIGLHEAGRHHKLGKAECIMTEENLKKSDIADLAYWLEESINQLEQYQSYSEEMRKTVMGGGITLSSTHSTSGLLHALNRLLQLSKMNDRS